ncbi:MAG: hypothetical protein J4G12_06355 [Gemmatimonadetes bacterium]|nr:hypothetical protein [Gemmatimonadota bacterium]
MKRNLLPALLGLSLGLSPGPSSAQNPDLVDVFEPGGGLVADLNGDGAVDFVTAALVLGGSPSASELAAAAEISARLGFETSSLDIPISRWEAGSDSAGGNDGLRIVIGRSGLAASGLIRPGIDPLSLDPGEGSVSLVEEDGRSWLIVVGGDDAGLLAAARLFAGVLPHVRNLSSPGLSAVRADLESALAQEDDEEIRIRVGGARARTGTEGVSLVVADLALPGAEIAEAVAALERIQGDGDEESDSTAAEERAPLAYRGLGGVAVRIADEGDAAARPATVVRLAGRADPVAPGPVPGRPGAGGKGGLDLSNLYTSDGLLGGGAIPSRTETVLVPGANGSDGLPDLGARLGLESTGLVLPLAVPADAVESPGSLPTLILTGTADSNAHIGSLADSGKVRTDSLDPGEGLIQLVPDAFGGKSALVVTGIDAAGAERALSQAARTFPNISERGDDRPRIGDVERALWDALSGHSPLGQAAIGLYKLDRMLDELARNGSPGDTANAGDEPATWERARVLFSVEKAADGLGDHVRERVTSRLGLVTESVEVVVDDRDVQTASTIFVEDSVFPGETDRFWERFREAVLPQVASGSAIRVRARLSEPPELRRRIAAQALRELAEAGADPEASSVEVLSAFKQGYYWLTESVRPKLEEMRADGREIGEILIRFRRNEPPAEWPQQAMHTPVRWLHEIFPVDEALARDMGLDLERIRFEQTESGPTYEVVVADTSGELLLTRSFDPHLVLRPYFDRFRDYERVRVTTGWLSASVGEGETVRMIVDERIPTDAETFWDHYQSHVLTAIYDHVMELHDGLPLGGSADAPYFGELTVELEMSEPDYRLEIDNEIHSPMDALHEEIYFGTLEFFDLIGRNSRGQGLTFPGRVIPVMRPVADGEPPKMRVSFTGFKTSRPAVIVTVVSANDSTEKRLDIPKSSLDRPSARLAKVVAGEPGLAHLALRVEVDTEVDLRDSLITVASPLAVDRSMVSAEQIESSLAEMEALRAAGFYTDELAFPDLGEIEVWAEWSHEPDPESRRAATLAANGEPPPHPDWRTLLAEGWSYSGERLVQWDTPMPPPEGHRVLAEMADAFDEVTMYRIGRSYLGKDIWAADLTSPISGSHFSRAKASVQKPTVIYSAREHANEVSSTSHVLRHAELLLTDPEQRAKLDRVNVIVHPFTNPDGAQLAYDLFRITPDFILHAGYLGSLGQGATSGGSDPHPIYPEAAVRQRLWEMWTPDVFLNPHGYPSHQVVQLFSEYSGLVRRGRVTERNWGLNKGWFMPGFGYVDSPNFPRHKDAAFSIRGYVTEGINSNRDVFEMNQRTYERYRRYGAAFDPEVFRLPMIDSVMIHMPLKGSSGGGGGGYDPAITIWSGITEAPDETAYGPWLELVAKAGLSWDQAIFDYLHDGDHEVKRSGSSFFGGVSLRIDRARPPEVDPEESEPEDSANATSASESVPAGTPPGSRSRRGRRRLPRRDSCR